MKESALIKLIFDRYWYDPEVHVIRNNTGAYKSGKTWIRYGEVGSPDIWLVCKGRLIGVECKTEQIKCKGDKQYTYKGRQSKEQKSYQAMIERVGVTYVLAYDLPEVEEAVRDVSAL